MLMGLSKQQKGWRVYPSRLVVGAATVLYLGAAASVASAQTAGADAGHWVGTWATVPVARCPGRQLASCPNDSGPLSIFMSLAPPVSVADSGRAIDRS